MLGVLLIRQLMYVLVLLSIAPLMFGQMTLLASFCKFCKMIVIISMNE